MEIKTNHSVNDTVWVLHENKAMELIVGSIGVDPYTDNINYPISDHIYYILHSASKIHQGVRRHEGTVYKTKEALLKSL